MEEERVAASRQTGSDQVVAMITSPLEQEYVDRIIAAHPDGFELVYRPDLLSPPRYVADHTGAPDWKRTPAQAEEWYAHLRRANVLWDFAYGEKQSPLELSPALRWVQTTSAGVGQYVKRLGLQESDVIVTTASGVHSRPLSEFVFAALLFHNKKIAHLQAEQKAHRWARYCATELHGQTIAIVGPGRIGQETARLAHAFGMTVWAMASDNSPARAEALGVDRLFASDGLKDMLRGADCVALCCPHTPETEGLIGPEEVAAFKPGVVLVNISRGVVIDEDAMIAALRADQIGLAALDVFRTEPLPADSPLWDMPNVLVNPHSASTADTENSKITDIFIHNLGRFLAGDLAGMAPVLNKARLY